jgi:hypothetical protein
MFTCVRLIAFAICCKDAQRLGRGDSPEPPAVISSSSTETNPMTRKRLRSIAATCVGQDKGIISR